MLGNSSLEIILDLKQVLGLKFQKPTNLDHLEWGSNVQAYILAKAY